MKTIGLTNGQLAIVDDTDYVKLSEWAWSAWYSKITGTYYALRYLHGGKEVLMMHNAILEQTPIQGSLMVDHRNGDTLDNRRQNLRSCTNSQNQANSKLSKLNTSGYRGVVWDKRKRRWRAQIRHGGRNRNLGRYMVKEDAARAYDAAAKTFFGEFASLNFPG